MSSQPLSAPPPSGSPPPPPSPPTVPSLKCTLLGDASTGKTALRQCFIAPNIPFSGSYRATIGCDFLSGRFRTRGEEEGVTGKGGAGEEVVLQVWDTAGQERFRSLAPAFYRSSHACVLVYSLTSADAPSTIAAHLASWFRDFAEKCPVGSGSGKEEEDEELRKFAWVAVGTKADEADAKGGRRHEEISEEVERMLEKLLPRRLGPTAGPPSSSRQNLPPPPTMKVEVLPPRRGRRVEKPTQVKPLAVDPTASNREPPPPAESAKPPPTSISMAPSTSSSTTASASLSVSASTSATASSTDIPSDLEPPEPVLDLLTSTSPPSPPPHFGTAGAPPAIWVGGPFSSDDPVLGTAKEEEIEAFALEPDHRAESGPPFVNYDPSGKVGPKAAELEAEQRQEDPAVEVLHGEGEEGNGVDADDEHDREGEENRRGTRTDEDGEEEYDFTRDGIKHFRRTSAKTGEGVDEVFDYLARRALFHLRQRRSVSGPTAGSNGAGAGDKKKGVIKVNEHEKRSTGKKIKEACCS
ncbi:hypothetical protein JCM11251_000605 [Rhodosporidiobolus azoricus]